MFKNDWTIATCFVELFIVFLSQLMNFRNVQTQRSQSFFTLDSDAFHWSCVSGDKFPLHALVAITCVEKTP